MSLWDIQIPLAVTLAAVVTLGYMVGRRGKVKTEQQATRSKRDLRKAQFVAGELEKIAWGVRKNLAKHNLCLSKFKRRIGELESRGQAPWEELCHQAQEMLTPTMQLATQIANACDLIREQTDNLLTFTEVRTDPLTGIGNRRALDDALNSHLRMLYRHGRPFSLIIFDVDHFTKINDQKGRLQGDQLLHRVAELLAETVRETDLVVRYGGEEFVVVMPEADLQGAAVFADRLREKIENVLPFTVSGGLTVSLDGDTPDSLLTRIDAALYSAKTAGRNCVHRHDGEQIEPILETLIPMCDVRQSDSPSYSSGLISPVNTPAD